MMCILNLKRHIILVGKGRGEVRYINQTNNTQTREYVSIDNVIFLGSTYRYNSKRDNLH